MESRYESDIDWLRDYCSKGAVKQPSFVQEEDFADEVFWLIQEGQKEEKARKQAFLKIIVGHKL